MKYDPSNRPEIVLSTSRTTKIRLLLCVMLATGVFMVVTGVMVWSSNRGTATDEAKSIASLAALFVVPTSTALSATALLGVVFSARRNATFRMMTTFAGLAMVMTMVPFQQSLPGIVGTLLGLVVIGLAFWPDKAAKAEAGRSDGGQSGAGRTDAGR
ncbi:MAG: hypothetical protein ACRCYU_21705 [Nocardioides sp.]